jgi:hypothetical protein
MKKRRTKMKVRRPDEFVGAPWTWTCPECRAVVSEWSSHQCPSSRPRAVRHKKAANRGNYPELPFAGSELIR